MKITTGLIAKVFPSLPTARRESYAALFDAHCNAYQIDTRARLSAFWAQIGHESGDMRWLAEIWGPTAQQRRYEPPSRLATQLGNTEPGDGKRFKGRGLIQVTGRSNYEQMSVMLKQDLVANPELLETPNLAVQSACAWWDSRNLNELADLNDENGLRRMTRRINGGFNGWQDRLERWRRIRAVLATYEG